MSCLLLPRLSLLCHVLLSGHVLLCVAPAPAAALPAGADWSSLREATRRWRVHAWQQLGPTLKPLQQSADADLALMANYLHARWLVRSGEGKAALAELERIRTPLQAVSAPAFDWAWIEALQASGQLEQAFACTAAFRETYKDFRWAAADLLYSRLSEKAAKPEVAAQLALQLYEKSNLHLPRDELLARAARLRKSTELWRRLLLKHPESDYVEEAARVVDPASFSDDEQFARMDLLFQRRAYERCRAIGLMLWAKNHRRSEVGWYLGKIGSERLRDDYPGAVTYLAEAVTESAPLAMTGLSSYALALLKVGKQEEAVAQYDTWLKRYPDAPVEKRVELHYDRGRALRIAGKPLQAAADLAAFLETHKSGFDLPKYQWFVAFWSYLGGDCKAAIAHMEPLLKRSNPLEGGKARYWTGRCQDKLGQREAAIETMASLVQSMQLTWYGALAEQQLRAWGAGGKVPVLADLSEVAKAPADPFADLPKGPRLRRLRLATYLGEADLVQRVWEEEEKPIAQAIGKAAAAELRIALADPLESYAHERKEAYKQWGGDLRRAPTADTVAHWRAIYPRAYATHVEAAAARHGVPEWMVYAHMLQESRYEPWLISGAPAYGLLELLDRTAARLARDAKEDYQLWMLMTPAWNVHWGAQYLGALVAKFHRQLPFAMASYNGGPMLLQYHMTVAKAAKQPLDEMIDDMGPHESRNYVRMVAGHFLRYLAIYETPKRAAELRAELLPAEWKAAWLPYPDY